MEKSIEMKAGNVDLAVERALEELNVSRDNVEVEVLAKGGLFSKAQVRVTVKETAVERMNKFINGVLEHMGLVSHAAVTEENNVVYVQIHGDDSSAAIGYRGETLDALQYLAMTYINENKVELKRVVVDCEDYRERRKAALTALALRLAEKSVRLRRKIELEPMNPFERRVIHSALADGKIATTQSEGEDMNRHIVIVPVGVELKDERPLKDGERNDSRDRSHDRSRGDRRNNDRRGGGRNDRRGGGRSQVRDDRRRGGSSYGERKPRKEEPEVEDGNVYLGYFTEKDDFVKPTPQGGPPKYKSFGGKKRF